MTEDCVGGSDEGCVGGSVVTFDSSLVVSDIMVPLTVTEAAGGMLVTPILPTWPRHKKFKLERKPQPLD